MPKLLPSTPQSKRKFKKKLTYNMFSNSLPLILSIEMSVYFLVCNHLTRWPLLVIKTIKKIFFRRICLEVGFSSQKSEMLKLVLTTNTASMTSHSNQHQHKIEYSKRLGKIWLQVVLYFLQGRSSSMINDVQWVYSFVLLWSLIG